MIHIWVRAADLLRRERLVLRAVVARGQIYCAGLICVLVRSCMCATATIAVRAPHVDEAYFSPVGTRQSASSSPRRTPVMQGRVARR